MNETKSNVQKEVDNATSGTVSNATSTVSAATSVDVSSSVSEATGVETSTQSNVILPPRYDIANHADWNYDSDHKVILADLAYWLKRVKISTAKGLDNFDFEAYSRVYRQFPTFETALGRLKNKFNGLGADDDASFSRIDRDIDGLALVDEWTRERRETKQAVDELLATKVGERGSRGFNEYILDSWEKAVQQMESQKSAGAKKLLFDFAYNQLEFGFIRKILPGNVSGFDGKVAKMKAVLATLTTAEQYPYAPSMTYEDMRAMNKEQLAAEKNYLANTNAAAKKEYLLNMYKDAAKAGRYKTMPASKGNHTEKYIKEYVEEKYPEWGKVLKVSEQSNLNVHRDKLGNITYRSHEVLILCEDQGYKVLHGISLHEDYEGSRYMNAMPRNDRWSSGPVDLVK